MPQPLTYPECLIWDKFLNITELQFRRGYSHLIKEQVAGTQDTHSVHTVKEHVAGHSTHTGCTQPLLLGSFILLHCGLNARLPRVPSSDPAGACHGRSTGTYCMQATLPSRAFCCSTTPTRLPIQAIPTDQHPMKPSLCSGFFARLGVGISCLSSQCIHCC